MVKPLSELPFSIKRLDQVVQRGISRLAQRVAKNIGASVVDATRVDTGKARSNWRATLDTPASGTIPPYAPGNKLGQSETANAGAAKAQQSQVIGTFNVRKNRSIFITNSVDYIETLNNGGPRVAPGLMVEQGFQTGRDTLKTARILDKF